VQNASRRSYPNTVDDPPVPYVRQRRASLSTARELVFNENPTARRSQETSDLPCVVANGVQSTSIRLISTHASHRNGSVNFHHRPQVVSCPSTRNASPTVDHRIPEPAAAEKTSISSVPAMNGVESKSLELVDHEEPKEVGSESTSFPRFDVTGTTEVVSSSASCLSLPVDVEGARIASIEFPILSSSILEESDHSLVGDSITEMSDSVPSMLMMSSHVTPSVAECNKETGSTADEATISVKSLVEEKAENENVETSEGNIGLNKNDEGNENKQSTASASIKQEVAAENIVITVLDVPATETSNGGELTPAVETSSDEQTKSQAVETAASKENINMDSCQVDLVG